MSLPEEPLSVSAPSSPNMLSLPDDPLNVTGRLKSALTAVSPSPARAVSSRSLRFECHGRDRGRGAADLGEHGLGASRGRGPHGDADPVLVDDHLRRVGTPPDNGWKTKTLLSSPSAAVYVNTPPLSAAVLATADGAHMQSATTAASSVVGTWTGAFSPALELRRARQRKRPRPERRAGRWSASPSAPERPSTHSRPHGTSSPRLSDPAGCSQRRRPPPRRTSPNSKND